MVGRGSRKVKRFSQRNLVSLKDDVGWAEQFAEPLDRANDGSAAFRRITFAVARYFYPRWVFSGFSGASPHQICQIILDPDENRVKPHWPHGIRTFRGHHHQAGLMKNKDILLSLVSDKELG